jgi:hypothetical protein
MTYGFQFFNNSDELVIDDTTPKPWFVGKGTYVSAEVSTEYAIAGYTVYKLTYTTPSTPTGGAVYISWPPNPLTNVSYCLESTVYLSGQNVIVYAAVNNNYGPTSADVPQVFCFSFGYVTNYTGGWGAKIFDATGTNCVFDADAKHLKIDASSDNANSWGGGSALDVQPSTTNDASNFSSKQGVGTYIENPAFLTPKIEAEELVNNGDGTFTRNTYLAFFGRFNTVIAVWQPKVRSQLKTGTLSFTGSKRFNNKNLYDFLVQISPRAYISPLVIEYAPYAPGGVTINWPQASYSLTLVNALTGTGSSVTEDFGVITGTVTTTNINPGTVLRYVFSGTNITAGDFGSDSLEGTFSVASNGVSTFLVTIKNDQFYETTETATCTITRVNGAAITGTPANVTIIEGTTTYSVSSSSSTVSEGNNFIITCTASNFKKNADGLVQTVNYTLSQPSGTSFDANDWTGTVTLGSGSSVTANRFVFADGDYQVSRTFTTRADNRTDGAKVLRLTIDGNAAANATVDVTIQDTSQDYTWSLSGATSVNEGSTYTYTATTNGPVGSSAIILLTTPATADISDISLLNGQAIVAGTVYTVTTTTTSGANSVGTFTIEYKADLTTEGSEYFTLALNKNDSPYTGTRLTTLSGLVNIADTSVTPEVWTLTAVSGDPSTTQVKEGTTFTARINSSNIPSYPRTVYYKFTGISQTDIYDGTIPISGSVVVTSNSQLVDIGIREDYTTEADEIVYLQFFSDSGLTTALTNQISWTIHDTLQLSRLTGYITEGFAESITISSYGLSYPATVYGKLTGTNITGADFTTSTTDVSFVLNYQGAINFTVGATLDFITEGIETVTLTLYLDAGRTIQAGNSVTWDIYDTSTTITKVSGNPSTNSINEGSSLYYSFTTNAPLPRYFYAVLSGISGSDITLNTTEIASYISYSGEQDYITMAADQLTEGTEYVSMQYYYDTSYTRPAGNAVTWQINDTSTTPLPVYTFTRTPTSGNINEGGAIELGWSFSNVPLPITLYYIVTGSGITAGDTALAATSGSYTIYTSSGSVSINITADALTEGTETATLTWYTNSNFTGQVGNQVSFTINDTSLTPPPAAGTVVTSYCSAYTYVVIYNDGSGGTYYTTEPYSANCSWTTPSLASLVASPTQVNNGGTFYITATLNHNTNVDQTIRVYYSLTGYTKDAFFADILIPAGYGSQYLYSYANTYSGYIYITGYMLSENVDKTSYMHWN